MDDRNFQKLRQLGVWSGGSTPPRALQAYWDGGSVPWVTPKDMTAATIYDSEDKLTEEGAANLNIYSPGDIAVVFRSGVLRHTFPIAKGAVPFTVNQDLKVLHPSASCAADYVFHALAGLSTKVVRTAVKSGTTVESVDPSIFLDLQIFLPPLPEQHQIADILDTVDAAIRRTEEVTAKLELVKKGLLHDLLTRGIDENGELRDPERHPEQFKESELGRIPRGWAVTPLGALAEVFNGTTPSRTRPDYWQGAVPWLASGKVNDYRIETPSEFISETALAECGLHLVPPGSVVIGMIGQGKTRGMSALTLIETTINQNLAAVIPNRTSDGTFLHLVLHWHYNRLRSGGRGSNQDALNCQLIRKFDLAAPSYEEQHQIAKVILSVDQRVAAEQAEAEKLRLLKKALMDDLLTGKVRVTPLLEKEEEEPASEAAE